MKESSGLATQIHLGIPSHFFADSSGALRQMKTGSLDPSAMDRALAGIGG
jgi:hypothetical protein